MQTLTFEGVQVHTSKVLAIVAVVLFHSRHFGDVLSSSSRALVKAPANTGARRRICSMIPFILGGTF